MRKYLLLAAGLLAAGCATKSHISKEIDRLEAAQKRYNTKDIKHVDGYLVIGNRAYVRLVTKANSEEHSILETYCRKADKNKDKEITFQEISELEKSL